MKRVIFFIPILLAWACTQEESRLQPKDNMLLAAEHIAFEHLYTSNTQNGKDDQKIEFINFKIVNKEGMNLLNFDPSKLAPDQYYAVMEIKVSSENSDEITLNNGLTLRNDGKNLDIDADDPIFTSVVPVGYQPSKSLNGRTQGGSFEVGCDFDIIYDGESCDDGYECDAWAGYCYCFTNCSFKLKIEW